MIQAALIEPDCHPPEQVDRAGADVAAQGGRRQPPRLLDEGAVVGVQHGALAGQPRTHVAHLASAHRVRLPGQRERSTAWAADCAGGQVQVDQGVGVPGAVGALVEAHRPARHPVSGLADQLGRPAQVGLVDAGQVGDHGRRIVGQQRWQILPALRVFGDERLVDVPVRNQQMQQAVEQGQVGARLHLQEQVGVGGGRVAARIDHDQRGSGPHSVHHPQVEDRMAVGHIRADDEEHVGVLEVGIRARRAVRAQRELVPGAGAGHAQPRVRFQMGGADEALGEFGYQVLRLQRQLARDVERDGVRAVGVHDGAQPTSEVGDGARGVPGLRVGAAIRAHHGLLQPARRGQHLGAGRTLGAQPAAVGRVLPVADDLGQRAASGGVGGDVQHHAAADPAIGAGGLDRGLGGHGRSRPSRGSALRRRPALEDAHWTIVDDAGFAAASVPCRACDENLTRGRAEGEGRMWSGGKARAELVGGAGPWPRRPGSRRARRR